MQKMQSRPMVRPDTGEDTPVAQDTAARARRALLVLAAGAFAVGTDAFVIAGILPAVAHGVSVSVSWAGALMTGFALTYAVAAPVLSVTFSRLPRRGLLVAALTGFTVANALAAVAPSFALLMVARVVAALAAALFTPTASALAAELAPPRPARPGARRHRDRSYHRAGSRRAAGVAGRQPTGLACQFRGGGSPGRRRRDRDPERPCTR